MQLEQITFNPVTGLNAPSGWRQPVAFYKNELGIERRKNEYFMERDSNEGTTAYEPDALTTPTYPILLILNLNKNI